MEQVSAQLHCLSGYCYWYSSFSKYGAKQDIKVHLGTKTGEIEMVDYYKFINGSYPCCCIDDPEPCILVCKNGPAKNNFMLHSHENENIV